MPSYWARAEIHTGPHKRHRRLRHMRPSRCLRQFSGARLCTNANASRSPAICPSFQSTPQILSPMEGRQESFERIRPLGRADARVRIAQRPRVFFRLENRLKRCRRCANPRPGRGTMCPRARRGEPVDEELVGRARQRGRSLRRPRRRETWRNATTRSPNMASCGRVPRPVLTYGPSGGEDRGDDWRWASADVLWMTMRAGGR